MSDVIINTPYCRFCQGRVYWGRYDANGRWEPDYNPDVDSATWRHENGYAACTSQRWATPRPEIVVLCGSTRFWETFQAESLRLTLEGVIVLSVGAATTSDEEHLRQGMITPEDKEHLDELHKRKIDLADRVLVLNVGGYAGESTRSEIEYAYLHSKPTYFLEPTCWTMPDGGCASDNCELHGRPDGQIGEAQLCQ